LPRIDDGGLLLAARCSAMVTSYRAVLVARSKPTLVSRTSRASSSASHRKSRIGWVLFEQFVLVMRGAEQALALGLIVEGLGAGLIGVDANSASGGLAWNGCTRFCNAAFSPLSTDLIGLNRDLIGEALTAQGGDIGGYGAAGMAMMAGGGSLIDGLTGLRNAPSGTGGAGPVRVGQEGLDALGVTQSTTRIPRPSGTG